MQQSETSHVAVAQTVVRAFAVYPEGHEKLWSPQVTTAGTLTKKDREMKQLGESERAREASL